MKWNKNYACNHLTQDLLQLRGSIHTNTQATWDISYFWTYRSECIEIFSIQCNFHSVNIHCTVDWYAIISRSSVTNQHTLPNTNNNFTYFFFLICFSLLLLFRLFIHHHFCWSVLFYFSFLFHFEFTFISSNGWRMDVKTLNRRENHLSSNILR